ncbi:MAG TPA: ester cyclase [Candidatus Eremiobacteraceae bacterium]|nr:ester cyclase [Candidatus Eremiobacteraceae bacterium]
MSEANNRRLVEESFAALNAHDLERYVRDLDDSYISESDAFRGPVRGKDAVKQLIATYLKAFPDLRFEIEHILASGEYVVSRWRSRGMHRGEFDGVAPTNRPVSLKGCTVSEIRHGRIVKSSIYFDELLMLEQLGIGLGRNGQH